MWAHAFHEFLVWFNNEYWATSWPNIFAPSLYTILGFVVADMRNARRHKAQKLHHVNAVNGLAGQIEELSDRLRALIGGTDDDVE